MQGYGVLTGPIDGRDLGPADPFQWICREWVQKLGFDGAKACLGMDDDQIGAKKVKRSWGEQLRYQKGPSSPLQAAGETPGGRLLRSTDIRFWIKVRFRTVSASGNQFRRSRLFFLLTACAKHTGLVAAGARLWIHHHHQPSSFY